MTPYPYTSTRGRGGRGEVYSIYIEGQWHTTAEAAARLGKTPQAIRAAIIRGSAQFIRTDSTPTKETHHDHHPHPAEHTDSGSHPRTLARPGTPPTPQSLEQPTTQTEIAPTPTTKAMHQNALAKYDLIALWREYVAHATAQGITKLSATDDFLIAFKEGAYPRLRAILGSISRASLYAWDKTLRQHGDNYESLIAAYRVKKTQAYDTTLSPLEKERLLAYLLSENQLHIDNAIRLVRYELHKKGHPITASESTYRRYCQWWRDTHKDQWVFAREGAKALKDKLAPYLTRDDSLLQVGDVLVADGHTLNIQTLDPLTGRPCRATLICYMDWASRDIAGYSIMTTENTAVISDALRHSILRLGKLPKVSYQDNGRAFRSKFFTEDLEESGLGGIFAKLGIAPMFAMPYNARSKVVERFFVEFATFEKLLPAYVGQNALAKPASLSRNESWHRSRRVDGVLTIEQTTQALEQWLEFYRSQPHPTRKNQTIGEVFEQGRGAGIEPGRLEELMMKVEYKKVGRNGIRLMNRDYYHEHLYAYTHRVQVRYSLHDLSHIYVYDQKGEQLCIAHAIEPVHPMAPLLGSQSDMATLKRELKQQKKLEKQTVQKHMRHLNPDITNLIELKEKKEETQKQEQEQEESEAANAISYEELIERLYG